MHFMLSDTFKREHHAEKFLWFLLSYGAYSNKDSFTLTPVPAWALLPAPFSLVTEGSELLSM